MKKVSVKTVINVPIERVWEVLTDIRGYSTWNPFVYEVSSDKEMPYIDCNMVFYVRFSNGKEVTSKEYVTEFKPPQMTDGKALWVYRFDGFMHKINMVRATRTQTLRALSSNTTEYSSEEVFSGFGELFLPLKEVKRGFIIQADALKKVCESDEVTLLSK